MNAGDGWLMLAITIAAALYAAVGHGGASAYLAMGTLAGLSRPELVPLALTMNILVAGSAAWNFRAALRGRLFLSLTLASMPAAFLGASISLPPSVFTALLGAALFLSGIRLMTFKKLPTLSSPSRRWSRRGAPLAGFLLGLSSGMLGIGGGVFLSPLVILLGWGTVKEAAALSSAFIVANSLSGLSSFAIQGHDPTAAHLKFLIFAITGGALGSYLGAKKLSPAQLAPLLGALLMVAAGKLWTLAIS